LTEIVLSRPDRSRLVTALARAVHTPERINLLLDDIGFQYANRPSVTGDPEIVWRKVVQQLELGAVANGIQALLRIILVRYPANDVFSATARRYAPDIVSATDKKEPDQSAAQQRGCRCFVQAEQLAPEAPVHEAGFRAGDQVAVGHRAGSAFAGHVFLCYAREDAVQVDRLQRSLEVAGIPVWRDTADLWPGQDWRATIRRAITDDALVFLACFSRKSLARRQSYQNTELDLALQQMRLRPSGEPWLIPVRFDDCEIPDIDLVGFQNSATSPDLGLYAARSYSLMRPPRIGRRLICSLERSASG
jgi:hypothetical protein